MQKISNAFFALRKRTSDRPTSLTYFSTPTPAHEFDEDLIRQGRRNEIKLLSLFISVIVVFLAHGEDVIIHYVKGVNSIYIYMCVTIN